jgi:serine/threonine protein kinase
MIQKDSILRNKYRIQGQIGVGGMATVYSAIELASGERVAVKVMDPNLTTHPSYGKRFALEANIGIGLNHPNIAKTYSYGFEKGQYYLVMEYIEGSNLKQWLHKKGRIDTSLAIKIILPILSALSYAYHNGIQAHRDLKPENVMIDTKSGTIKVMDFGIAKVEGENISRGELFYSPHYSSPEQFMPTKFRGVVDRRSDLYSIGVLFYEMITGRKPFTGESSAEIAENQLMNQPPIPSILISSIPPGISQICKKALSYNPNHRYQTPEALAIDLKKGMATTLPPSGQSSPSFEKHPGKQGYAGNYQSKQGSRQKAKSSLAVPLIVTSVLLATILFGFIAWKLIVPKLQPYPNDPLTSSTNVLLRGLTSNGKSLRPNSAKEIVLQEKDKQNLTLHWKPFLRPNEPAPSIYKIYLYQLKDKDSDITKSDQSDLIYNQTTTNIQFVIPPDLYQDYNGFTYRWQVSAVDAQGKEIPGSRSNPAFFVMPPLDPPTLFAPGNGAREVSLRPTFEWKSVPRVDGYFLYIRDENNLIIYGKNESIIKGSRVTLKKIALQSQKEYSWFVQSVKSSRNSKVFVSSTQSSNFHFITKEDVLTLSHEFDLSMILPTVTLEKE